MSLEDLALRTGLSVGLLSQMERGRGNPSFVTLMRIANAFQVQLGYFFSDGPQRQLVVRRNERRRIRFPATGLTYELCTPDLSGKIAVIWTRMEPGMRGEEAPLHHEGEECLVLTRGVLEAHIGDQVVILHEGDSVTFDCSVPHWYYNPGPDIAETIGAMTPAAW